MSEVSGSRMPVAASVQRLPTFAEALRVWLKIGCLSFGGPAGQIALMHREVVEERRWVGEARFLSALNFCTLLPGPEAQQLATYLGWLMHGVAGGVVAGGLFILPGALLMLLLAAVFATYGEVPAIAAVFFGLKSAVLALVIQAVVRIGRRALSTKGAWVLAAAAFVALFVFGLPFPLVVFVAAALGYVLPGVLAPAAHHSAALETEPALLDQLLKTDTGRLARLTPGARRAGLGALALWLVPLGLIAAASRGRYGEIAIFFSKMAVVTVGGAYAVLAYVAQDAVRAYHWLSPSEMLAGLGLAETTPGPLILVLEFVGFVAGFRSPEGPNGLIGGVLAAALTLWMTFLPCFAFVFLGAPIIEKLLVNQALSRALAAVTAAVVGVIANLAVWFALRILFTRLNAVALGPVHLDVPDLTSLDWRAAALALLSALALFRWRLGVPATLAIAAGLGLLLQVVHLR